MKRTIVYVLLTMLFSSIGCRHNSNHYPVPPTDAQPESFVKETRPFEIGSESYQADFGTTTVPENRNRSASRLIAIPFLRIYSRLQHPAEPIFGLAGGPGASNMSWDWGKAGTFLSECGHVGDMWYANGENTRLILKSFYDTGVPNTSMNRYIPMDFHVAWPLPTIVKIAIAAIALLGIGLVTAVVWLLQRFRVRKGAKALSGA